MKSAQPTTYDRADALMPDHNREFMDGKLEPDSDDVKAGPKKLYDIGRGANTQFLPKQHRDMFYGKRHVQETKFKEISEFANKPIIRSTFYRRTGLPGVAGGG